VFGKEKIFKSMSRIIERKCDETFEEDIEEELPLLEIIIGQCFPSK